MARRLRGRFGQSGVPGPAAPVWPCCPRLALLSSRGGPPSDPSYLPLDARASLRFHSLRKNLPHHAPADVRKPEVPARIPVGESLVVEAEEVEDGGVQVVDVDDVLDGAEAEFVG